MNKRCKLRMCLTPKSLGDPSTTPETYQRKDKIKIQPSDKNIKVSSSSRSTLNGGEIKAESLDNPGKFGQINSENRQGTQTSQEEPQPQPPEPKYDKKNSETTLKRSRWRNGAPPSYWVWGKYICEVCGRECGYANNFNLHRKRKHGLDTSSKPEALKESKRKLIQPKEPSSDQIIRQIARKLRNTKTQRARPVTELLSVDESFKIRQSVKTESDSQQQICCPNCR